MYFTVCSLTCGKGVTQYKSRVLHESWSYLDVSFDNFSVLANRSWTAQKDEAWNLCRMGKDVGELGVLGSIDFLNTGHDGESTEYRR